MPMILNSIKMNNFKSHVSSKIVFNNGVVAIIGENGSGKSSIFEAVFFALFGADALRRMGLSYDEVITKGKKAMSVELEFEVNGNKYKIIREYNGKSSAKLYKNNELFARTVNEVNKAIVEILGVDRDMFLNSIYIKQGEIANLLNLQPRERKEVIGKLLGIEEFEKCYQKMKDAIDEYKKQLERIIGHLNNKHDYEEELKEKENELKEKETKLKLVKEKLDRVMEEFKTAEKIFEDWKGKKSLYEKLTNKLEERQRALELANKELENLKYDLNAVVEAKNILRKYKSEFEEYKSLTIDIKTIEERLRDLHPIYEEYLTLSKKLEAIDEDIKQLEEFIEKSKYKDKIDKLNEVLGDVGREIEKLEKIKDYLTELENLYEKLEEIERYKKIANEYKEHYEKYMQLDKKMEKYNKLNLDYTKLLQNKKSIEDNIKNLKSEIEKLENEINKIDIETTKKSLKAIEEYKNQLEKLQQQKEEIKQRIGEVNNEIKRIKKVLDELKDVEGKCPLCKTPIDSNKKQELINSHRIKLNDKYNELKELHEKIKAIEEKITAINKEIRREKELRELETKYYEKLENLKNLKLKLNEYEEELNNIKNQINNYIIDGKPINELLDEIKQELNEIKDEYNNYISAKNYLSSVDESNIKERIKAIEEKVKGWDKDKCKEEIKKLREEERYITHLKDKVIELKKKREEFRDIENKMLSKLGIYKEYTSLNERLNALKKRKDELESIYNKCNSAEISINNIKKKHGVEDIENYLNNKVVEVNKRIEDIEERIKYICQKLSEINYSDEGYKNAEDEFKKKQKEVNDTEKELKVIESRIEYLRDDINNIKSKLEKLSDLEKEKEKLEKFIEYLSKIRKLFGKDGFQRYLRKKYVPIIQNYLNEAFNEFDLPYSFIELTEDFDVKVHSPNGVLTIDNLSGGEQIAVALSLRLAIANALIGNRVECIILDEPTIYLDENRRAKLAEIFRRIDNVPQMIIITHHRELEDVADTIINVVKEGGISKVKI